MSKTNEIEFPVEWNYRIVIKDDLDIAKKGIVEVLRANGVKAEPLLGKCSSGGKYQTFTVSIIFQDREMMNKLSGELSVLTFVKLLL